MAFEQPLFLISRRAGAGLSAAQYRFVALNANGEVLLAGAGDKAIGVLQNDPLQGQAATVQVLGISKVVAGGAINIGDYVASDASGKAKAAVASSANTTTGAITGSHIVGIALEAATAADQVISVLLIHAGGVPGTFA